MTKKVYIALFLIFLLGMLVVGCQRETTQTSAIPSETYNNGEYGFSLSYPRGWGMWEDKTEEGIYTIVFFDEERGPRMCSVNIVVFSSALGVPIEGERDIKVGGLPAKETTFTVVDEGLLRKGTVVSFLGKNSEFAYKILYYVPVESYSSHYDHFNLIVNTFKFTECPKK